MLKDKIEALKAQIADLKAENEEALEALRIKYLSKKGEVTALFNEFREVAPEEKRELGQRLNELKNLATEKINALREATKQMAKEQNKIDITRPAFPAELGTRHPISVVRKQIIDIFSRLGFTIADGPEVEDDWHVFSALNFAADHPARDMQDTFFIEKNEQDVTRNIVLRSHTSSVQVRTMERQQPPIRIICPGRVYRADEADATHSPVFHQMEGLVIDENITMGDLKGTLDEFARQMYGEGIRTRFRPSFFPFTEPSAEVDLTCANCKGEGCRMCKGTGWIEVLGAGMVNPKVLEMCGIDSRKYSGFAFGMGVERIALLKYNIPNLRYLYENDLRFLTQYR